MAVSVVTVHEGLMEDWSRMRQSVYSGLADDFNEQEMRSFMSDATKECLIVLDERRRSVAMIEVALRNVVDGCLSSPVGYIEGIFVEESCRRTGLARMLVAKAEAWCKSKNCSEIATDAELENSEAQRFHQHMGFEETYRTVGYRKTLP